jgi:hypothetical protein
VEAQSFWVFLFPLFGYVWSDALSTSSATRALNIYSNWTRVGHCGALSSSTVNGGADNNDKPSFRDAGPACLGGELR